MGIRAGDHENPIKTVDFDYDDLGNLTAYNDGTTSATYEYDDLQRKTLETLTKLLWTFAVLVMPLLGPVLYMLFGGHKEG